MWLSVLAVVVAEGDANVVHPSWYNRFDSAIGISRVDVYDNDSPHQYRDALSAALLPRLCLLLDSPIRRNRSYMLPWRIVGEAVKKYYDVKRDDNESANKAPDC